MRAVIISLAILFCGSATPHSQAPSKENRYPNELVGYRLYAEGNWKSLEPYVSTGAEARKVFGESSTVLTPYDSQWSVKVVYFGDATINGKPWGKSLKGTIASINFYPRLPVSFKGFSFPPTFKCNAISRSPAVAPLKKCSDGSGLSYFIYTGSSADKMIQAGDLSEIEYGPSDKVVKKYQEEALKALQP